MTSRDPALDAAQPDLLACLAHVLHTDVDHLPEPLPYDDAQEARMSQVADTRDEETGRSQPLRPRKDWRR